MEDSGDLQTRYEAELQKIHDIMDGKTKVWRDLVSRFKEGQTLTPEEIRILAIRTSSLSITDVWYRLLHDQSVDNLPGEKDRLLEQARQDFETLGKLGIEQKMHEGKGKEFVSTPERIAEWIGGQLMEIKAQIPNIPSAAAVEPLLDEFDLSKSTPLVGGLRVTDNHFQTPTLRDYFRINEGLNSARSYLGYELNSQTPAPVAK